MNSFILKCNWLLLCCVLLNTATAQYSGNIAAIEKWYEAKNYTEAEKLTIAAVSNLIKAKNTDSLVQYILWTGKLENKKTGVANAMQKVATLIDKIKSLTTSPNTLSQAYIEAGEFYGLVSQNEKGYVANQQALQHAGLVQDEKHAGRLANIENNMATYAQRMGDISLSIAHGRKALQWMQQVQKPDYDKLYLINNSVGTGMYYMLKLDSSLYFFNNALNALYKAQPTAENRYYRPAIVQNNIAGIYGVQGKTTAGITAMKATIENLKRFLATREPHKKKANALEFQLEATDNLAGIYKEIGDYRQAEDLLLYSYQQKKKLMPAGNTAVFKSEILLGQLYYAMRDYTQALQFLNSGLTLISAADGDYLFWQADACNTLALLYDEKKNNSLALTYYEKADSLYEASLQGEYDNIYLEFLTNAAQFYAAANQPQLALQKADKGYKYVVENEGAQTLSASYQLLNLSEVHYLLADYRQALSYGNKALTVLNAAIRNSDNLLDSVKAELKKPKVILVKVKAQYQLLPAKTVAGLSALLQELDNALLLLERRKALIDDTKSTALLIADNSGLLEFIKQLNLDLYQLTNDPKYLDRLVGLHESGLYNRIRARLDANDSLQLKHAPPAAQATEKKLKTAIANALQGDGPHDEKMQTYLQATSQWNAYQDMLRNNYPRYYAMRYASVFKTGTQLQQSIPAGTTAVRYFYIDKNLYAFTADSAHQKLYTLHGDVAEKAMAAMAQNNLDAATTGVLLQQLYQCLWAPFAADIRTQNVVIIPDRNLYNLSFELLTPKRITNFKQLATESLLARYAISYHYSLFLLKPAASNAAPSGNFVAFAPGFSDEVKMQYRNTLPKQDLPDNNYLNLLPQPFTLDLVRKTKELFGGQAYVNDQSTAGTFKANAGRHKIIHIGTHAEADNLHPEYSRLIFTKNIQQKDESNSLFLPDIYNCDLSSDLTVLTACETGRPGYQDGEGMISLAHAFNYAGSQSILTSLWKIDEQASASLTGAFYQNLAAGMAKDEALRQAKLSYLTTNEGRTLSPQYWAGLVLMGNTSPLQLPTKSNAVFYWIAGGVLLLLLAVFIYKRKQMKRQSVNL